MRKNDEFSPLKNIDEKEIRVKTFSKKENKNENKNAN